MKKTGTIRSSHLIATAGAALALGATSGQAQFAEHFYLGVDGGAAFQENLSILDNTGFNAGGDVKFDTGGCVGVNIGYNFCRFFSAELNPGVILNNISSVGNQPTSGSVTANLDEIPILVNGIFTYPLGAFKPYVGAGLGAAFGVFDSQNIPGSAFPPKTSYDDTDVTFAYQFLVGVKYSITPNLDLGVAYKFLGTTDHSWNDNNINLKTSGTAASLLEATITWRF